MRRCGPGERHGRCESLSRAELWKRLRLTSMSAAASTKPGYAPPAIQVARGGQYPAGPGFLKPLLTGRVFGQGPEEALLTNAREYGDLIHYRAAGRHIYQFNHPELIHEMLVVDARHHHRGMVMQRSKLVLGEGLLTSEEPLHMRQRRLAQPAFHRDRIAGYGRVIGTVRGPRLRRAGRRDRCGTCTRTCRRWPCGSSARRYLTGDGGRYEEDRDGVDRRVHGFLPLVFLPFSETIQKLPIPMMQAHPQEPGGAGHTDLPDHRRAPGGGGGPGRSALDAAVSRGHRGGYGW